MAAQPQSSELSETLPRSDSMRDVVRKWLLVFGEVYRLEVTPLLLESWCIALRGLDAALLDSAFDATLKTCKAFPTPAHVKERIAVAAEVSIDLEAENAWSKALDYCKRYGNLPPGAEVRPIRDVAIEAGIRAAGGVNRIEACPREQLPWAKKAFLQTWRNVRELPEHGSLLTTEAAKELLQGITRASSEKLLQSGQKGS